MLELKNIHYSVDAPEGRTEILRDISLTIPDKSSSFSPDRTAAAKRRLPRRSWAL